jgi:hypothetical protein
MPTPSHSYLRFAALCAASIGAVSFPWLSSNGLSWLPWCLFSSLIILDLLRDTNQGPIRWKGVLESLTQILNPAYAIPLFIGFGMLLGGQLSSNPLQTRSLGNSALSVSPNQIGRPPAGVSRPAGPIFTGDGNVPRPTLTQPQPRFSTPPQKMPPTTSEAPNPESAPKTTK